MVVIALECAPRAGHHGTTGQTEVEWEEALLMPWGAEIPMHPAAFYRRKNARARQIAEGVTTRAMKAKLLEDAGHCDRLATKADRAAEETAAFKIRPIDGLVSTRDLVKNDVNKQNFL